MNKEFLRAFHNWLGRYLDELEVEGVPEQSIERLKNGICVCCGVSVPAGDKIRRGCDEACHRKIDRNVQRGDMTDKQAVNKGLWLPKDFSL